MYLGEATARKCSRRGPGSRALPGVTGSVGLTEDSRSERWGPLQGCDDLTEIGRWDRGKDLQGVP